MTRQVTATAPYWRWTNDPADPCGLCVVWEENADDPMADGRPVWPDGSTVPRIYKFTHRDCNDAALRYSMERD